MRTLTACLSFSVAAVAATAFCSAGCADIDRLPPIDLDSQIAPVPDDFGHEADLDSRYQDVLLPMWNAPGLYGWFSGAAGVGINYRVFRAADEKGVLVLLTGRTEPIIKYVEVIADLVGQGYSVYAMDLRGQGWSGRMLDNPQIGYVEFFGDYVADVHTFVEQIVEPDTHPHLFALAHSMGAAVLALYLYQHPEVFEAVVLSSPMFGLNTDPFPEAVAGDIALTGCGWGDGRSYALGQGDNLNQEKFDNPDQIYEHSQARWNLKMRVVDENPEVRMGGVSYRWLCEAMTADAHLRAVGRESRTRTLLLQAGIEKVALPEEQTNYCAAAAACQGLRLDGAYHELLMETDAIRNQALTKAVRFLDHFAQGGTP